jgi:NTE family protein
MSPKIGLVLGGGGSRGLAHIGVLEVLGREQVPIDLIVGTSMGGIVGVLFGLGFAPNDIAQGLKTALELNDFSQNAIRNVKLISSRARQQRLREQLQLAVDNKTFADLSLPVTLMAVDMVTGQEVALKAGPLLPALLATAAVPGVFPPVRLSGMQLADGGVIDSLATHVAFKQGAEKVIAVDVYPALETDNPWTDPLSAIMGFQLPSAIFNGDGGLNGPNVLSSMWRSVRVMTWHLHQQRLAEYPPDILLRPNVDNYGSLDFKDLHGPIEAGVMEADKHVEALRSLHSERTSM